MKKEEAMDDWGFGKAEQVIVGILLSV